jgi:hypothetical protein
VIGLAGVVAPRPARRFCAVRGLSQQVGKLGCNSSIRAIGLLALVLFGMGQCRRCYPLPIGRPVHLAWIGHAQLLDDFFRQPSFDAPLAAGLLSSYKPRLPCISCCRSHVLFRLDDGGILRCHQMPSQERHRLPYPIRKNPLKIATRAPCKQRAFAAGSAYTANQSFRYGREGSAVALGRVALVLVGRPCARGREVVSLTSPRLEPAALPVLYLGNLLAGHLDGP